MHKVDLLGLGSLLEWRVFRAFVFARLPVGVERVFVRELRLFECGGAAALVQRYVEVILKLRLVLVWFLLGFLDEEL